MSITSLIILSVVDEFTRLCEALKIKLSRGEKLLPDEAAEAVRKLNELEKLTPEELARRGLDEDELRRLGLLCSFTPDTPVLTDAGLVSIVDIEVGDLVLAYHEGLGANAFYPVEALLAHEDPVVVELTIDGELVETTPEHSFFVEGAGWVPAGELLLGDRVRSAGGAGVVDAVESVASPQVMYNLTVAEAHTFFVGDGQWLVYNVCVNFPASKLQHESKHAPDFGVTGNWNKANRNLFREALQDHIDSAPIQIQATYRKNIQVTRYCDPTTGLWAAVDLNGNFVAAWRLYQSQVQDLLTNGSVTCAKSKSF